MMDAELADRLRAEFPRGTVGTLPKPYKRESPKGKCAECGGFHGLPAAHLDFVGHAAVTDRLLSVDPCWTWEPVAFGPDGLPALDRQGNLWIRLTVGGVTRLGVGDGTSIKETIGDAIRNAAMRFGVALSLWTKDELESGHAEAKAPADQAERDAVLSAAKARLWAAVQVHRTGEDQSQQIAWMRAAMDARGLSLDAASDLDTLTTELGQTPTPAQADPSPAQPAQPPPTESDGPRLITYAQQRALHAGLGKLGVSDDERHGWLAEQTGRTITSAKQLTAAEAHRIIDYLRSLEDDAS